MWTFDIFRATASDLHRAYEDGSLTIETAINTYLSQIEKCNGYLHAVISISPRELVIRHAKQLDKERMEGKSRGPLHGVPVIIKVQQMLYVRVLFEIETKGCRTT